MKKTVLLALSTLLVSTSSLASPERCEFDKVEGELVEFSHPQTIVIRNDAVTISDKKNYPRWYHEANMKEPISRDEYFGRMAKIRTHAPVKTVKENTFKDVREKLTVRYYSAIADNCQQIYLRVIENDFPQYFSKDVDFLDHKFKFLEQEKWAGVTFIDNFVKLQEKDISLLTIRPKGSGQIYFVNKLGTYATPLKRYESVEVVDAKRSPLYLRSQMLSNYKIEVKYKGERGFINSDYQYMFNGNPLLDVDNKFFSSIANGKLMFGMKKEDVLLSLGLPDKSISYPIYRTHTGFVTDYLGNYESRSYERVGHITHWSYEAFDQPLIFNQNDVLLESKQQFSRFDAEGLPSFMVGVK